MTISARVRLTLAILGVAGLVEAGLVLHMMSGPDNVYPTLRKPLVDMSSLTVGDARTVWPFVILPGEKDVRGKMNLDLIYRHATSPEGGLPINYYIVHGPQGEDRKHHPEVCIRDVMQIPEDKNARAILHVGGDDKRPVQRFSFVRGPSQNVTVYYWHYTFLPETQVDQTWLQMLYRTFDRSPPSVTVLATTNVEPNRWAEIEAKFLPALDAELRENHLPEKVRMGCERLPIALVDQGP